MEVYYEHFTLSKICYEIQVFYINNTNFMNFISSFEISFSLVEVSIVQL